MQGVLDIPEELREIQSVVVDGLARVSDVFDEQLRSELPPVDTMCAHIERYRGKMLRPTLVLLCNAAARGSDDLSAVTDRAPVVCGAVSEMVHMATLVHDDVLDEAEIRRRGRTINAMKGNETSVILGDYLIASAYELCSSLESPVPSRIVGRASAVMCTGELLQLHNRNNLSLDEPTYFEILKRKTAALIGAACELGARSALGFDRDHGPIAEALRNFGLDLGIAFQIQDDVLDLTGTLEEVGKSVGKDLEKGKLTYPIIHHLAHADDETRERSLIDVRAIGEGDSSDVASLIERIEGTGSLEATRACAVSYVESAKSRLSAIPDGVAKPMLTLLADAVVTRSH